MVLPPLLLALVLVVAVCALCNAHGAAAAPADRANPLVASVNLALAVAVLGANAALLTLDVLHLLSGALQYQEYHTFPLIELRLALRSYQDHHMLFCCGRAVRAGALPTLHVAVSDAAGALSWACCVVVLLAERGGGHPATLMLRLWWLLDMAVCRRPAF